MSTLAVDNITNVTGTSAMSIDSSGNITASSYIRQTSPIAFSAKSNSGNIAVNGVFPFSIENFDIGGNYDPALYRFVAPVSGIYHIDVSIHSSTGHASPIWLRINGSNHFRTYHAGAGGGAEGQSIVNVNLQLNANDYIDTASGGGGFNYYLVSGYNEFSGYLIG